MYTLYTGRRIQRTLRMPRLLSIPAAALILLGVRSGGDESTWRVDLREKDGTELALQMTLRIDGDRWALYSRPGGVNAFLSWRQRALGRLTRRLPPKGALIYGSGQAVAAGDSLLLRGTLESQFLGKRNLVGALRDERLHADLTWQSDTTVTAGRIDGIPWTSSGPLRNYPAIAASTRDTIQALIYDPEIPARPNMRQFFDRLTAASDRATDDLDMMAAFAAAQPLIGISHFGFVRNPADALALSARPINWLAASGRNKFWEGLGGVAAADELSLFPGLLPPLLAFAAFALLAPVLGIRRDVVWKDFHFPRRAVLVAFDIAAAISLLVAFLTIGYGRVHFRLFGFELLKSSHSIRPLILFAAIVCVRLLIGVPEFVRRIYTQSRFWVDFRSNPRSLAFILAATWMVLGFFGSLGMNFWFHRLLWEVIFPFRSIRAPARWAMICYLGLAILAGWGAVQVVRLVKRWLPSIPRTAVYALLIVLMLFEQRVAPIQFARGEVDPDQLTIRLKQTPMSGGLVELPAERDNYAYSRYVLRAIDHGRPIVTAVSSFSPPIVQQIESMTLMRPIPDSLLDLLEGTPASYLVVHNGLLPPDSREAIEWFIERGLASGRLRFVNSYGESPATDDLYAVSKIEPNAKTEATRRTGITFVARQYLDILARYPERAETEHWNQKLDACGNDGSCVLGLPIRENSALLDSPEFRETGGFVYGLYRALGRTSTWAEWERDRKRLRTSNARTVTAEWVTTREFVDRYPISLPKVEYVDKLIQAIGPMRTPAARDTLVARLTQGKIDRAGALLEVITNSEAILRDDSSFVTLCYFIFLKRDPENGAVNYWVENLRNNPAGKAAVIQGFLNSSEYRTRKN